MIHVTNIADPDITKIGKKVVLMLGSTIPCAWDEDAHVGRCVRHDCTTNLDRRIPMFELRRYLAGSSWFCASMVAQPLEGRT